VSAVSTPPPPARRASIWTGGWTAGFVLLFYVALYPIHGFQVALGSDTPVYVWWARYAGAAGIGGLGTRPRPAISGLIATLARVTGIPASGIAEALGPILAASLALAAGALVLACLGQDRRRFVLTVVLTGSFLSLMVSGYLSTLAFGTAFVAALAVAAERADRPGGLDAGTMATIAGLVAAAGLFHLQFLVFAGAVAAGVVIALAPAARRDMAAGRPASRTAAARVAGAMAAGAALAVAGFAAVGGGPHAPETSRDAVLRRAGLGGSLVKSYRRKLLHDFPWFRALTTAGLAATALRGSFPPRLRALRGRWFETRDLRALILAGAVASWLIVTIAAVVALRLGIGAPGQRLAAFCLPLPILAAMGLARLVGARRALAAAGVVLFVVVGWLAWGGQRPLVTRAAVVQARAAGADFGRTAPGTPLVVVMDDLSDKPGLFITRYENYLRDEVPAARVPDVHVFVGTPTDYLAGRPSLTGQREHDALALMSWADVRTLPAGRTLAMAIEAFDPRRYAEVLALPGATRVAPGVAALPGRSGVPCGSACPRDPALTEPGAGPLSPWLPVWLAPALLVLLGLVGHPWTRLALSGSESSTMMALSPAFGLAALSLAAVLCDVAGLELSGPGGWAALAVAASGWVLSPVLRAREAAP
jgi:hypothetical protein